MNGLINNPKKEITVNFSLDKVMQTLKAICIKDIRFVMTDFDDVLNRVKIERKFPTDLWNKFRFEILVEESDGKSKISIEVSRAIGAFNRPGEVTVATSFMSDLLDSLSKLIREDNPIEAAEAEVKNRIENNTAQVDPKAANTLGAILIIGVFLAFLI